MQVRCPQCHTPIDLSEDSSLSEIACPSCGSIFSLIGQEETAPYEAGTKTIGHFELVEQIGTGTFGSVWRAKDGQTGGWRGHDDGGGQNCSSLSRTSNRDSTCMRTTRFMLRHVLTID